MTVRSAVLHIVIADVLARSILSLRGFVKSRGNLSKITVKRVNLLARLYFFQTPQSLLCHIVVDEDFRKNRS